MKFETAKRAEGKFKLDIKDKKILQLLAKNARESRNIIAKKVKLSKDAVIYRIKKYEEFGLLQGTRAVINAEKLGYLNYHVLLQIPYITDGEEKKFVDKIQKNENVRAILKFSGKFRFELAIIAKNISEFQEILKSILSDSKGKAVNYEILQISTYYSSKVFPDAFLKNEEIIDGEERAEEKINDAKSQYPKSDKLDQTDKKILFMLAENSEMQYYEIANKLRISADAVSYRVKNLLQKGIIKNFVPIINYNSISYSVFSILVRLGPEIEDKKIELKEFIRRNPHFLWAVECIGKYNMIAYLCVRSIEEYHSALNDLYFAFGRVIIELDTLIAYEEFKLNYFPKNLI